MPLPISVRYELRGTIIDPNTQYEREIVIDESTSKSTLQTELTALQTAGVLADQVTTVKNLIIREHAVYASDEGGGGAMPME